jgi:transposase
MFNNNFAQLCTFLIPLHIVLLLIYIYLLIVNINLNIRMPKIINDKRLILKAYNNRHRYNLTIKDIAELFEVDPKTINNYKHQSDDFINTDSINRCSFMHHLSDDVINFIIDSAVNNPYFNNKVTLKNVKDKYGVVLTSNQIYCVLESKNITYKKAVIKQKSKKYTDDELDVMINDVQNRVVEADNVIFTDEVHIELSDTQKYGWNVKGKDAVFIKDAPSKILNKRFTVIASVSKSKKICYKIHEKSVNGESFKKYINYANKKGGCKNHFLDNARIHHYGKVKDMMKRSDLNVIYGVPYTPFLNIIENFFRSFKSQIRKELLKDRSDIKKLIRKCWNNVSEDVLKNTYRHVYSHINNVQINNTFNSNQSNTLNAIIPSEKV